MGSVPVVSVSNASTSPNPLNRPCRVFSSSTVVKERSGALAAGISLMSEVNSYSVNRPITACQSGSCRRRSEGRASTGTWRFISASFLESMRSSTPSVMSFLVLSRLMRSGCSSISARLEKSAISSLAVFSPMPFTPGMLSAASPTRAMYSVTRPGGTLNRSSTYAVSSTRSFIGS